MRRIKLGIFISLVCVTTITSAADDSEQIRVSYRVTFDSTTTVVLNDKKVATGNTIVFDYVRARRGNQITVWCRSMTVTNTANGVVTYEGVLDRDKVVETQKGTTHESLASADPETKKLLDDSFSKPLLTIDVDDQNREVKRVVTAAPGAKLLIASGAVTTCTLFHVAPHETKRTIEWNLPTGGVANGEFTYTDSETPGELRVNGGVAAEKMLGPEKEVIGSNFQMKLEGTQQYDAAIKDWKSGSLKGTLAFTMHLPKGDMDMKGEMTVTLQGRIVQSNIPSRDSTTQK